MKQFKIGEFDVSKRVFIIAELSANHGGSLETALASVRAAKQTGADAIKIQTYRPDTITLDVKRPDFKVTQGTLWDGRYLYELYQEAYTPWEWHQAIFEEAKAQGLLAFSSPFDFTAVDLLESLQVPAYKIASFEITDIPLIEYTASKGKPIILSTGIATDEDIKLALDACRRMGNETIALLKCTSSYPAPIEEANMLMVRDFAERFDVVPGLSDHTMSNTVPVVATALGARIIEKHFIIDRSIGGPDAAFSLNVEEFSSMVNAVRDAEKAMGEVNYALTTKQQSGRDFARSLYVTAPVRAGDIVTHENVKSVRPGFGMHPRHLNSIIGRRFKRNVEKGEPVKMDLFE